MDPAFGFDEDAFRGILFTSSDTAVRQLTQPEVLFGVFLVVVALALLVLVIASMTEDTEGTGEWASMIGAACSWVCPWQPSRHPFGAR